MPTPAQTRAVIHQPLLEEHCNSLGQIRAGYLLKLIDILGAHSALKCVDYAHTVVTASLDRTNFKNTIRLWEFIAMESQVTQIWGSSMEVVVHVYAESPPMPQEPGVGDASAALSKTTRRHVATAYLVYVAFDRERRKAKLPQLKVTGQVEMTASLAANMRKQRRIEESQCVPMLPLTQEDAPYWWEELKMATPRDANINGNVFGGVILEQMTRTARLAAEKHCLGATVVGARIDRMSFVAPGFIGEEIRTRAVVTRTFKTSLELQVEVHAVNPNHPGQPRLIANAYVVFVRVTPLGAPADVPPWLPVTAIQQQRAEDALARRQRREEERRLMQDLPDLPEDTNGFARLKTRWVMLWNDFTQRFRLVWRALTGSTASLSR